MDVPTMFATFEAYGFETDDEMTDDRKLDALNEVYLDACRREPWPFLQDWTGASVAPGSGGELKLSGSASSKIIRQINRIWQDDGHTMEPIRLDDFGDQLPNVYSTPGAPRWYTLQAGHIWTVPMDDSVTSSWNIAFIRDPAQLTLTSIEGDILVPVRYHRSWLVMGTLSRLAVMQDDPELGASYERLYEKALAMAVESEFHLNSDRPEYIHINDPDNYDYD